LDNLVSVDLSSLQNLEVIGDGFLACNVSLKKVDFSSLKNLKKIGTFFLAETPLKEIDLTFSRNLEEIGEGMGDSELSKQSILIPNKTKINEILPDSFQVIRG
jgi:hypothetical protein